MADYPELSENDFRLLHDLRGPLVNIRGFAGEVDIAVADLAALMDQHELPEGFRAAAAKIFKDDLRPCLDFLDRSIKQLNTRIDQFAHAATESTADAP